MKGFGQLHLCPGQLVSCQHQTWYFNAATDQRNAVHVIVKLFTTVHNQSL